MELDYEKNLKIIDFNIEKLIKEVILYMPWISAKYIEEKIRKSYEYAKEAHKWQIRLSWQPYINHPVEATQILLSLGPDVASIQACLLHDVIEDTPKTYEDIKNEFWEEVAFLCSWMEKLWKVKYKWEDRAIWSLRKMFVAMAEDLRVILIKLSDRLHNMRTLEHHPKIEKRRRIALETLNIYVPIAARLWLYNLKNSLEEWCFKILKKKEYLNIKKELKQIQIVKENFKKTAIDEMKSLLNSIGVNGEVSFRIKSIYSIYRKMNKKDFDNINDLYDIYGIRVLVDTVADCYKVLWEIHAKWNPLPYRFKDYIALPKPNWYRSLHTTVIGFLKKFVKQPTEIQIRTFEMHREAEIWVAAHFEYKEVWSKVARDVNWVKELKELTENLWNQDLMSSLKIDVFKDRIFAFTPKWDTVNLPSGSTPIDFAYYIHTDLWNHISVAKVNHTIYPLDKELKNGDIVEITIDKNKSPTPFRISFVKTSKAKNRIRAYLKRENKDLHRDRGREILNKYLESSWYKILDKDLSILKIIDGRWYSMEERFQLLEQIWNFSLAPSSLIRRVFKPERTVKSKKNIKDHSEETNIRRRNIIIGGEDDLPHVFCKRCLNKDLTDKIVAHINSKWIFTIHSMNCNILKTVNKDRLISAYVEWNEGNILLVEISFLIKNTPWILKTISEALFSMDINVDEIHSKKLHENNVLINLSLDIFDHDYLILDRFIDRIKMRLWSKLLEHNIWKIRYK